MRLSLITVSQLLEMFKILLLALVIVVASAQPARVAKAIRQKRDNFENPINIAMETASEVAKLGEDTIRRGMDVVMNPINKVMAAGQEMMGASGRKRRSLNELGSGEHGRHRRCGRRQTTPPPSDGEEGESETSD